MNSGKEQIDRAGERPAAGRFDLSDLKIEDRKRSGRGRRWLGWFAAIVGALLLAFGGLLAVKERPPAVEITVARRRPEGGIVLLHASGYVTPRRRATVAAKITGRLNQVLVEEGIRVEAGQRKESSQRSRSIWPVPMSKASARGWPRSASKGMLPKRAFVWRNRTWKIP